MDNTKTAPVATSRSTAIAALIIGGIVMGFSPVFVREAEVGAFASAFWRVLFALPPLFIWAWWEKRRSVSDQIANFHPSAFIAGLLFSGDLIFWHLSILNTTMANATFMVCLSPVWVALFSNLILGERISRGAVLGLAVCILGLGLLISSSLRIEPERLIGDVYGLITSLFLGLYFLAMRNARRTMASGNLFFVSTIVTTFTLLVAALVSGDAMTPTSASGWASLFSLGFFTHAGGQGLVTIALGSLSAMFSSLVIFIEAVAAALFGWWIFDESMTPLQLIGGALILCGVWLARPEHETGVAS